MKLSNKFLVSLFVILLIAFSWLCFDWWIFLKKPIIPAGQQSVSFVFVSGMSARKAAAVLRQQNLITRPLFFTLLMRLKGQERSLKAGEYYIESGKTTPWQLLEKMIAGDSIRHAFTIVEGWTFQQMIVALNANSYVKHTVQQMNAAQIMAKIGHPNELPEGRFAPDTYLFSGEVTDTWILIRAYQLMQRRLQIAWDQRSPEATYTCPYSALIAASLIEKETAYAPEKPIIAGVILHRLSQNKLLQVDPTVIYGMGAKYNGKLSKNDCLKDTSYNTYTRKGLPPSPIAMPSLESIEAALHPKSGTYLYYVAKGDGTHHFSNTFREQTNAVKKYLRHK